MEPRPILPSGQPERARLTAAWLARRLAPTLASDFDPSANAAASARARGLDPASAIRDAAVLVPLIERGGDFTILLTRRTAHLARHAGQISFPGGRIEPDDASPIAAALRETEEEIGLAPSAVTIIGRLEQRLTGTGFAIAPAVGLIRAPIELTPDPHEVELIFEVPLALALDLDNYRSEPIERGGRIYRFDVLAHDTYYIWGATASILRNLAQMIGPEGLAFDSGGLP